MRINTLRLVRHPRRQPRGAIRESPRNRIRNGVGWNTVHGIHRVRRVDPRFYNRSVWIHNGPIGVHDHSVRINGRSIGIDDGTVGINRSAAAGIHRSRLGGIIVIILVRILILLTHR